MTLYYLVVNVSFSSLKARWNLWELATEMQISTSVLRRKITFWQSHGILHEAETDVFELMEEQKPTNRESVVMIEEEEESVTASSQDMKEEELQVSIHFTFIRRTKLDL